MPILKRADGSAVTKSAFPKTAADTEDPYFTVDEDLYETRDIPGTGVATATSRTSRRLAFKAGQRVRQSDIDAVFPAATVTSITPATGPAAGGTTVTVIGTALRGVTGVTLGGVAGTGLSIKSETKLTFVTGAHASGAVNGVFTDDSGTVTKASPFFTYV